MIRPDPSRILVVDDHRLTRRSLCLLLRGVGYACFDADSAAEARQMLSPRCPSPAVAILDLWMPHEDGESLLRWIRLQPYLRDTRVLIYSAAPEIDHAARLCSAGATAFLPKPTPIPALLDFIARYARPAPAALSIPLADPIRSL